MAKDAKNDNMQTEKQSKGNMAKTGKNSAEKTGAEKKTVAEKKADDVKKAVAEKKNDDMKKTGAEKKTTAAKNVTRKKRSRNVAGILAIMTGAIGLHKFYLGQWKKGIFYVLFFWTGIPGLLGLLEGAHLLGSDAEPERKAVPTKDVTVRA